MRIVVRRIDFTIYVPPTQGESQLKRIDFKWRMHCPWCTGDGITWSTEWAHVLAGIDVHLKRHKSQRYDVLLGATMGDFEDTNLFRG